MENEIRELTGAVLATEHLIVHLAKLLVSAGIVSESSLHTMIDQFSAQHSEDTGIETGYQDTLQKLRERLTNIH